MDNEKEMKTKREYEDSIECRRGIRESEIQRE